MKRQDRLNNILEIVVEKGSIEVEEVAELLEVSAATIRRDFDTLSKNHLITRTHGGAIALGSAVGLPIAYKVAKEDEAKQRIAKAAAEMVSRHSIIGLNGGTTASEVARALMQRDEFSQRDGELIPALTVVTNAVNIAAELTVRPQIKIVVTGGVARPRSFELTGTYAEEVLKEMNIDIAFMGVEALDPTLGAAAHHEDEARINRQLASRSNKTVIITTSSKFRERAFAVIAQPEEIDVIITDNGIDQDTYEKFKRAGVDMVVV